MAGDLLVVNKRFCSSGTFLPINSAPVSESLVDEREYLMEEIDPE